MNDLNVSVSEHLRGRRRHLLQGLYGLLSLVLLIDAQDGVDDDYCQDDDDIRKGLAFHNCQHSGYQSCSQKDYDHRIRHLLKKLSDGGFTLGLFKFVLAVFCKALRSFIGGKSLFRAVHFHQHLLFFFKIVLHAFPFCM